ncbi:hypothetical protein BY458DRAFT_523377 [Sporodiniella umbellata]|nr:hypothetical protein BY458DRAFT_523377 [Sporodiniella umbellata]
MSKRFQNLNKYRNAFPTVSKKEEWYADISVSTTASEASSLIQVNQQWIATKWGGYGGSIGLLPIDRTGKDCASHSRVFQAHSSPLSDWSFSEFDDSLLATGAEDGMVKLWKIHENQDPDCVFSVKSPSRRVDLLKFHPLTYQILTSLGNDGKQVCLWDIEKSAKALEVVGDSPFHSFSWKSDGSLLATTGKSVVNIWDPRSKEGSIATGPGHEGVKGSKSVWLGSSNNVFTIGTDKLRSRQYALWDTRNMSKALAFSGIDSSTGSLLPLFDEDTETIYLISRGDSLVRSLQLSDMYTQPTIELVTAHGPNEIIYGGALLPKPSLDVMQAEIARIITISGNHIIPISYRVPKKSHMDFDANLFPDTKGRVPSLSSSEWLEGKNSAVRKVSLNPLNVSPAKTHSQQCNTVCAQTETLEYKVTEENKKPAGDKRDVEKQQEQQDFKEKKAVNKEVILLNDTEINKKDNTDTTLKATSTKVQSKYGSAEKSIYKYIFGKTYHPNTHFDDLRDLSINKSGECDLIQASRKFIAIPISGPGGRVGIINAEKPGRLPTRIPCILCGSEVTNFKFDPFNHNRLVTVSLDNKLRVWELPDDGIEEDTQEPLHILSDATIDKISQIEFHPNSKDVLLMTSQDLNSPTIRIWDLKELKIKIKLEKIHKGAIFSCAWSLDGRKIATTSKDKIIRVLSSRTGNVISEGPSHDSLRPSRVLWIDQEGEKLVSVGFGLGSSREMILYKSNDLSIPLSKKMIDVSPSTMTVHFDIDCNILFAAGRGDRTIHCYEIENESFTSLQKIEANSLQQGFVFLPKIMCNVKEIEIGKLYRLTATSIEPVGIHVPRARPELFQDDIFVPTLDTEHYSQEAHSWFEGGDKKQELKSLQPEDMMPCKYILYL